MGQIVVVGAGIGGLTTAAALAKAGHDVTVLEGHIYPGGCAGTFFHQGYQFDAGATLLAGFYPGGPMDLVARATGVSHWPVRPSQRVMTVHLPGGPSIDRWANDDRWSTRRRAFGRDSLEFWQWQESVADLVWDLGLRLPPWPPADFGSWRRLSGIGLGWLAGQDLHEVVRMLPDLARPISARLGQASPRLRKFIDAQLLISAQTTSQHTNSLYAAAALDMPRRGAVQVEGGAGSIARALVAAIEAHGARVRYRQRVNRVEKTARGYRVHTQRESYTAGQVIFNMTPPDIIPLLADDIRTSLGLEAKPPGDAWGAYMLYLGVDQNVVPVSQSNHHQIVGAGELSEAGSIFISFNPEWDESRAPAGRRAVTLSTHTRLDPWWRLHDEDPEGYQSRKKDFQTRIRIQVERIFPGLYESADLILPATPLSFARFTGRSTGWVGGIPQTHLWRSNAPRLADGLWMVGDSIFPGQSVAAAALGGLRVASDVLGRSILGERVRRDLEIVESAA